MKGEGASKKKKKKAGRGGGGGGGKGGGGQQKKKKKKQGGGGDHIKRVFHRSRASNLLQTIQSFHEKRIFIALI